MRKVSNRSVHCYRYQANRGSVPKVVWWLAVILAGVIVAGSASAQTLQRCVICHSKKNIQKILGSGRIISLYVDSLELKKSVHATRACTDCHVDIVEIPHRKAIEKVNCKRCHYLGNPVGAQQTQKYEEYDQSVHGQAVKAGNSKAPVCQDCHGAHDVKAATDSTGHIYKKNIPETCGRCHLGIYNIYKESVHSAALQEGKLEAPVCIDCHGEHLILSPQDPTSSVYLTNVAYKTCPKCHAELKIVGKYGIKTEQVTTFAESFHGVASKFGARTVANCASCHGVHDIRRPNDPKSSVYISNIPKTCGKCHPGANINYARGRIHVDPTKKEAGIIYYVSSFFKWLTALVLVGLVLHICLDLYRRSRLAKTKV